MMKFIDAEMVGGIHGLELTRRNLQTLLDKLDDPKSEKMLIDPDWRIAVKAVEDEVHYSNRRPGKVFMPSTGEVR